MKQVFDLNSKTAWFIIAAVLFEIIGLSVLHFGHAHELALCLVIVAISIAAIPFRRNAESNGKRFLDQQDLYIMLALWCLALPLCVFLIDFVPFLITDDEPYTVIVTRTAMTSGIHNLFGPSGLEEYANLGFIIFGKIAEFLGGVTLGNLRVVDGFIGTFTVVSLYALYRTTWEKSYAALGALVVGFNHAFIAQSRMCFRGGIDVLIETIAYCVLIRASQINSSILAFSGGIIAGCGFYFYYPARCIMPLWIATVLFSVLTWNRGAFAAQRKLIAIALLSFTLTILPNLVGFAGIHSSWTLSQLLITKSGIAMQMERSQTTSASSAVLANAQKQLTCLNIPNYDIFGNYVNPHAAFCDPITGFLVWIGLLVTIFRRKVDEKEQWLRILSVGSFSILMLAYAFVIGCAPNYPRLIMLLPFIGYLVMSLLWWFNEKVGSIFKGDPARVRFLLGIFSIAIVGAILYSNIQSLRLWVYYWLEFPEPKYMTMRYIERRKNIGNYKLYIVTPKAGGSPDSNFFPWLSADDIKTDFKSFTDNPPEINTIEPKDFCKDVESDLLDGQAISPPLSVLVLKKSCPCIADFIHRHPSVMIHDITPDGARQALEINK
jgi:hypothetical protein